MDILIRRPATDGPTEEGSYLIETTSMMGNTKHVFAHAKPGTSGKAHYSVAHQKPEAWYEPVKTNKGEGFIKGGLYKSKLDNGSVIVLCTGLSSGKDLFAGTVIASTSGMFQTGDHNEYLEKQYFESL